MFSSVPDISEARTGNPGQRSGDSPDPGNSTGSPIVSLAFMRMRGDVVAGMTVAAYAIPQVMAYAGLAGLSPVTGLYALVAALAVYAFLGSSRQLSVGPESTTALLTAAALAPLAGGDPARYAALAGALALLVGGICLAGWALRLGVLAELFSRPVLVGYLAGVAITMIVSQLGTLTGVPATGSSVADRLASFLSQLDQVDPTTTAVSTGVLVSLLVLQWRWPPVPWPLVLVVTAAVVVWVLELEGSGDGDGLQVVGSIPVGVPVPQVPAVGVSDLGLLLAPALGVAVVGYTDNVLTGRSFAERRGETVDPHRELFSLGVANAGSGLVQGFPVSSSGSRTALGAAAGSSSQRHSLVVIAAILVALLAFRPVLERFPLAALGALIVYAAIQLVDLPAFLALWRIRRREFVLAVLTTVGVLALDILTGILVAVGLSVLELLARVARPHDAVQGLVPGMAGMHDVDDYPLARTVPGLVVYRYDAPLCFANAADFSRRVLAALDAEQERAGPVRWLLLNVEANVEIDSTGVAALERLADGCRARGVVLALARVKQDLAAVLERAGFLGRLGEDRVFPTLPTAREGFEAWQAEQQADERG